MIEMLNKQYNQRTVAKPVYCSGRGIHSNKKVNLTINPAPLNHGIKFKRTDLLNSPSISANFNRVVDTSLATVIGYNGLIVSTIEHLMASFAGLSIDNALIEIDAYEVPIMDGSAYPFTKLLKDTGFKELDGARCVFRAKKPVTLKDGKRSVEIYPWPGYKITYTIEYDHPLINRQTISMEIVEKVFIDEICRSRTFGFLNEYEQLKQFGLSKGCSLDNVVVIDKDKVLNNGGLRYQDEFVRHKILDCLGDFSLLGIPLQGHVVLNKSGHAFNHAFLKKFLATKDAWDTHTLYKHTRPIKSHDNMDHHMAV